MLVSVRRSHQAVKHSFDIYTKKLCGTDFFTKGLCDKSVDRQVGSQKLFVLRKAGWPSNNLIGAAPAAASALSILSFLDLTQTFLKQLRRIL